MNKNTYEAETLEEEFALLAGRLTALEAVLNAKIAHSLIKSM